MSSQNPVVVNKPAVSNGVPTSYPVTIIKQLEFKVENETDYIYLNSQNIEDHIIADLKEFCKEQILLELVSVDGVKVE